MILCTHCDKSFSKRKYEEHIVEVLTSYDQVMEYLLEDSEDDTL